MSNSNIPEAQPTPEATESFSDLLSQYEKSHSSTTEEGRKQIEGTVIAVSAESVFLDIGYKTEGVLPLSAFVGAAEGVKPGDRIAVNVKGRNEEGYYDLTRFKVVQPTDWSSLEQAFTEQATIAGTVTAVVKGGLSVDVGVRAFMPASRSGVREAAEVEKLVGQEIRCRILKLEVESEDVVVDRRAVVEEEERAEKERRYSELNVGDTVIGTVRNLADYGAFIDLGGVDGLLHVGDIAWGRIGKPADVLTVGQKIEARVLKIDAEKKRISLGLKQLQPEPWDAVSEKYKVGARVTGVATRLTDFGAFVELEPGIEGLVHVSEMSWVKKVRKPEDLIKLGDTVETVILAIDPEQRRISLGLKQALGDPWADVVEKFAVGSVVEGPVTSFMKFGAFVQIVEGVDGMIHISEISAEKHLNHPQDALKLGQVVKAQVLAIDQDRRQLKLSIKQLIPTSLDEFIAEHKAGDAVTGRIIEIADGRARVELGEGILATCPVAAVEPVAAEAPATAKLDMSALSSMLQARWKGAAAESSPKAEPVRAGQIRNFKITQVDADAKTITLELV
ncbi:MAG: 30S ribosomal protein S1 [Acidobacteriaceae bacterium]